MSQSCSIKLTAEFYRNAIETIRPALSIGFPQFNLPILAPFDVPLQLKHRYKNDLLGLQLDYAFDNLTIHNLDEFIVDQLDINDQNMEITLKMHFNTLNVSFSYAYDFHWAFLNRSQHGNPESSFDNLSIGIKAKFVRPVIKTVATLSDLELGVDFSAFHLRGLHTFPGDYVTGRILQLIIQQVKRNPKNWPFQESKDFLLLRGKINGWRMLQNLLKD